MSDASAFAAAGLSPRQQLLARAITDPQFHRGTLTGRPLFWPQLRAVEMVENAIKRAQQNAGSKSSTLAIRFSRQTGKNESAGVIRVRHLVRAQNAGGTIIRTAP